MIAEFPFVANNDRRTERPPMILGQFAGDLPVVARVHLDELQRLSVGKPAPEIEGVDLDGQPMKLSDFRGKVVVLSIPRFDIQGIADPSEQAAQRLTIFRGSLPSSRASRWPCWASPQPIATGTGKLSSRAACRSDSGGTPTGRVSPNTGAVWGPRPGPIHTTWDAAEPNIYVIDAHGVIRHTRLFVRGTLEKAVATILKEQEGKPGPPRKQGE